ncbi:hypothetical protein Acr_12g0002320 [Actinidia rufa]|uniref:Uncharacterized protein n=1 Tax=Actinidia rufa TaxID=165716 RepID=A0A7J0FG82_9ERIC|nr:hypothetical protein Acr_12g0002320 [Actinidia rufa]
MAIQSNNIVPTQKKGKRKSNGKKVQCSNIVATQKEKGKGKCKGKKVLCNNIVATQKKKGNGECKGKKVKDNWDLASDEGLVDIFIGEIRANIRPTSLFNTTRWSEELNRFHEATGMNDERIHPRNQRASLKDKRQRIPVAGTNNLDKLFVDADNHNQATPSLDGIGTKMQCVSDAESSNKRGSVARSKDLCKKKVTKNKPSKQPDRNVHAIESQEIAATYETTNTALCSIPEALSMLCDIPGVTHGDELFMLAKRLFRKRSNRDFFVALADHEFRLAWLREEQEREPQQSPNTFFG